MYNKKKHIKLQTAEHSFYDKVRSCTQFYKTCNVDIIYSINSGVRVSRNKWVITCSEWTQGGPLKE